MLMLTKLNIHIDFLSRLLFWHIFVWYIVFVPEVEMQSSFTNCLKVEHGCSKVSKLPIHLCSDFHCGLIHRRIYYVGLLICLCECSLSQQLSQWRLYVTLYSSHQMVKVAFASISNSAISYKLMFRNFW